MARILLILPVLVALSGPSAAWAEEAHDAGHRAEAEAEGHEGDYGPGHADEAEAHGEGHGEAAAEAHGEGHGEAGAEGHGEGHGEGAMAVPIWSVIPFVIMLLCIAVLPLTVEHWWESNRNKLIVACILGLPVGAWFAFGFGHEGQHELLHVMLEYLAFMVLLGSLYVISGGILLKGDLPATPAVNTAFLAVGAVLASFMGTTGAAMLLIRPLLSTNKERRNKVHTVIFFTFLVANIGGSLTPLGDPPLFMGYLRGVPFTWTLGLVVEWAFAVGLLLLVYYFWDRWQYRKEKPEDVRSDTREVEKLSLKGLVNIPLLAGVVLSVAFGQQLNEVWNYAGVVGLREVVMCGLAVASMLMTAKPVREGNEFTFAPIIEVAALFFGIFLTMIPAVVLLKTRGGELPVTEPWHFFWATGALSSFLDNTPTYVVFFELGAAGLDPANGPMGLQMVASRAHILSAISLGAVFMGAMTYIGNGPNFMVKAISDERGVKMPSFFGYMLYSCMVLLPVFVLVTVIFLL